MEEQERIAAALGTGPEALHRMDEWLREQGYDVGRFVSPRRSNHAPNPPGPVIDGHHAHLVMIDDPSESWVDINDHVDQDAPGWTDDDGRRVFEMFRDSEQVSFRLDYRSLHRPPIERVVEPETGTVLYVRRPEFRADPPDWMRENAGQSAPAHVELTEFQEAALRVSQAFGTTDADISRLVDRLRAIPPPDGGPSTREAPVYDDPDDLTDDELAARAETNTDWTEAIHEEPGQGVTLDELLGAIDEELGRDE